MSRESTLAKALVSRQKIIVINEPVESGVVPSGYQLVFGSESVSVLERVCLLLCDCKLPGNGQQQPSVHGSMVSALLPVLMARMRIAAAYKKCTPL